MPRRAPLVAASGRVKQVSATALPNTLSGLTGWWRADVITSPPADGATLQTWTDSSGASRSFTQATAGNRPTYRSTGVFLPNARPVVEFVAAGGNFMTTATTASTTVFTRFVVFRPKVTNTLQILYGGANGIALLLSNAGKVTTGQDTTGDGVVNNYGATMTAPGQWYISCITDDGGIDHNSYINSAQDAKARTAKAAFTSTQMCMGSRANGAFSFDGYIAEVIDYNRVLTAAERLAIHNYLSGKYTIKLNTDAWCTWNLDWDTGNNVQWINGISGLEAGAPAHQSIISSTVRRGTTGFSHRFEVHNNAGDIAADTFRCLLGKYDSQEGPTQGPPEFTYAFSFRVAQEENVTARLQYNQIWELHHRGNLYSINGLQLAPHAIELYEGNITYRLATGPGNWSGTSWTGYANFQAQQVLRPNYQMNTWYDLVLDYRLTEATNGYVRVWCRAAGEAWTNVPQYSFIGATLPWAPGGLDPAVPIKVDTLSIGSDGLSGLYLEAGLYTGSGTWYPSETSQQQIIYMDEMRRHSTLAAAKASFPA